MYGTIARLRVKPGMEEQLSVPRLDMVDKSISPLQTHFGPVFRQWAVRTSYLTLE